jgi:hypothetical protein
VRSGILSPQPPSSEAAEANPADPEIFPADLSHPEIRLFVGGDKAICANGRERSSYKQLPDHSASELKPADSPHEPIQKQYPAMKPARWTSCACDPVRFLTALFERSK